VSIAHQILDLANRNVNLPIHGDGQGTLSNTDLFILDDVLTDFIGEVSVAPELVPEFLLNHDPREVAVMEVPGGQLSGTFDGVNRFINTNDLIQFKNQKFAVIRFEANPADIATKYWLKMIVQGVDS
jgi:hypothetical protein